MSAASELAEAAVALRGALRETDPVAIVEREAPLAVLHQHAREAARGEGRVVLLAGEAGAGKTTLVEHFQRELPDATWAWGTCDGLSTPRPLAPLFDLADALGGRLQELCHGRPERDELFRALLQQVTAGPGLTAVVVEDMHWADEASLDLLRFLARRIGRAPVLLIVTYRDDWHTAPAPFRLALGELAALRWTQRLEVGPLSPDAVRSLAAGTALDTRELFELTGGNPFYVTEMIEAGTRGVPLSARDAVLARAARLSGDAAQVLATASLIGTRIEANLLAAASRCSAQTLDELIDSGLLIEDGTWLKFRHEIARLAVAQQVPAHRRRSLHTDVLAALRATGSADDARLAYHSEGAVDLAGTLRHAWRAARRAADLGSHREAGAQYERALRFAAEADAATTATLYVELAREACLGDRWQAAADADERALTLWRTLGDRLREGDTLRHHSLALKNLCRGDEAVEAAERAVQTLEPLGLTSELAAAYGTLATVLMMRDDRSAAIELARRAERVARPLGAIEVIADALNTQGCAAAATDSRWTEPVRRALELALSHDLQSEAGRAYGNLYGALCDQYRFDDAQQYYDAGIAYCDEHDLESHTFCLLASRTAELLQRGRWDEATAIGLRLLDTSTTAPLNRICPNLRVGAIRARRGEAGAWDFLDAALAGADPTGEAQYIVPVRLARAEARLLEGRPDDARREAELAADAAHAIGPWMRGDVAVWLRRTGSHRRVDGDVAAPFALQLQGRDAEAARAWDERGCRFNAAMALLDASAEPALREGLRRLDELGATASARLARRELRRLGVRSVPAGPRQATRADPLGVTPRERQVLELLCASRTNAEIARELFISAKTVDHHVSAVLAKLGVTSRGKAADAARRLGLVASVEA